MTSISAYSQLHELSPIDTDGVPQSNFLLTIHGAIDSYLQELRMAGDGMSDKLTVARHVQGQQRDPALLARGTRRSRRLVRVFGHQGRYRHVGKAFRVHARRTGHPRERSSPGRGADRDVELHQ